MMIDPPDQSIDILRWDEFLNEISSIVFFNIIFISAIIVVVYSIWSRLIKLDKPEKVFATYYPMYSLFIVVLIPIILILLIANRYKEYFGKAISSIGVGFGTALWAMLLSFIISYIVIIFITPAKFKYRPLWFLYKNK
jgi:hypothetical protein